jgi:hypothetical protein
MYALVSHSDGSPGPGRGGARCSSGAVGGRNAYSATRRPAPGDREVALVLTDIESSTELSSQDPEAFKQVGGLLGSEFHCVFPSFLKTYICMQGTQQNGERKEGQNFCLGVEVYFEFEV